MVEKGFFCKPRTHHKSRKESPVKKKNHNQTRSFLLGLNKKLLVSWMFEEEPTWKPLWGLPIQPYSLCMQKLMFSVQSGRAEKAFRDYAGISLSGGKAGEKPSLEVCAFELNPHADLWGIASAASGQKMSHQLHVQTPFLNGLCFARPAEEHSGCMSRWIWDHTLPLTAELLAEANHEAKAEKY